MSGGPRGGGMPARPSDVDRPFLRATLASFCNDKKAEREANIAAIALLGDSERAHQYFRANVLCRDEIRSRLSQCLQSIKFRLDVSGNEVTVQVTENLDGPEIEAVAVAVAGVRDELAKILGVTALRTSLFVRGKRAREEVPLLPEEADKEQRLNMDERRLVNRLVHSAGVLQNLNR